MIEETNEDKATELVGNFDGDFDMPRKLQEGLREGIEQALAAAQAKGEEIGVEKIIRDPSYQTMMDAIDDVIENTEDTDYRAELKTSSQIYLMFLSRLKSEGGKHG